MTDFSSTSVNKIGGPKKKGKKVKKKNRIVQNNNNLEVTESEANTITGGALTISPL